MAEKHPGISMHKLPVGGGFAGLLFAVGSALIFLFGLPQLWYFQAFSAAFGVGIALVLRLMQTRGSQRNKPLSILDTSTIVESRHAKQGSSERRPQMLPVTDPI